MLEQVTPLILTYNEAPNLERTLGKLTWANDIVVVDSFSDDATTRIASSLPQVRICQRVFDTHQNQWNFGLTETGIKTEWILALDADYVLTHELVEELKTLSPPAEINGYMVEFIYCLNGKKLRSGIYPAVAVLYRAEKARYEQDGHTHRVQIEGQVGQLRSKVFHDDRKPLRRWLSSQATYAELEAKKLVNADEGTLSFNDRVRKWRVAAPLAVLFYCLVVRGGVFDGLAGFYYAFQRALAELMLSLYLFEHSFSREETL
jgi:glycosyltransferase involved in cell wall biosynthesis